MHLNLDDPATTLMRAQMIQKKPFLKNFYIDFYHLFKKSIPGNLQKKLLVEIGSGGGFIKKVIPGVLTSDIMNLPGIDRHFSALEMPFKKNTVDAFLMLGVLHHLKDVRIFFKEADRCLKTGGKLIMIEPANTFWNRFLYQNFHYESFDPLAGWQLPKASPLSSANGALPWIIFFRDRPHFEKEFPSLKIRKLEIHTPFRYFLSGGFVTRQSLPFFTYSIIKRVEEILSPLNPYLGMWLTIELEKCQK